MYINLNELTIELIDELRRCIEVGSTDLVCVSEAADILEKQLKAIEQYKADFKLVMHELVKEAKESSRLHDKCDAQAKEIEQLNFVLKNLTLATNKKINELEEEIEHLKNKVQYWKGLHK